jgi:hypothetical protein
MQLVTFGAYVVNKKHEKNPTMNSAEKSANELYKEEYDKCNEYSTDNTMGYILLVLATIIVNKY